jgi:hypothetical protein
VTTSPGPPQLHHFLHRSVTRQEEAGKSPTNVTLRNGHDVAYFTSGQHRGGCAGAMSYYTAAGEPPGEWAGKGAAKLGLSGMVDPVVIERLYREDIGPGGQLLVKRRQSKAADQREQARSAAYRGLASRTASQQ